MMRKILFDDVREGGRNVIRYMNIAQKNGRIAAPIFLMFGQQFT